MFLSGYLSGEICSAMSCTASYVSSVCRRCGLSREDGGRAMRAVLNDAYMEHAAREQQAAKHVLAYGCGTAQVIAIDRESGLSGKCAPSSRYKQQRKSAIRRGIGWEFTLITWWDVWARSGEWRNRKRWHGYVMARKGDKGPYSPSNVEIITQSQNIIDSHVNRPWKTRFPSGLMKDGGEHHKSNKQPDQAG